MSTIGADFINQGGREILIDQIAPGKKPTALEGFMVDCFNLNYPIHPQPTGFLPGVSAWTF
jgi:hypothetical protein